MGIVDKITVLNTILTLPTGDNAILPNGMVANDKVVNYTKMPERRVDLVVGIGYGEDIDKAKGVILAALKENAKVLSDPPPFIGVLRLGESSVDLAVRPYSKSEDYWDVYFQCYESVKKAMDKAGIEIPFPQRDVHLKNPS
jgi:small conductance mechanosensitive channel